LGKGSYRVHDYVNDRDLGTVTGERSTLQADFAHFLMLEARPA
jgi:hypothetical protein